MVGTPDQMSVKIILKVTSTPVGLTVKSVNTTENVCLLSVIL